VNVRQIHSLWEVLPEQAVGVFVGTALPGTLWIAEEVEPVLAATLSQNDIPDRKIPLMTAQRLVQKLIFFNAEVTAAKAELLDTTMPSSHHCVVSSKSLV
jgi:hypothetical protein